MQPWPTEMSKNPCILKALHIFTLNVILKNVYIIFDGGKKFYINKYSN